MCSIILSWFCKVKLSWVDYRSYAINLVRLKSWVWIELVNFFFRSTIRGDDNNSNKYSHEQAGFAVESSTNPASSEPFINWNKNEKPTTAKTAPVDQISKSSHVEECESMASSQLEDYPARRKRTRTVTRMGRRKTLCKSMTNFVILHSNFRGLKSKV